MKRSNKKLVVTKQRVRDLSASLRYVAGGGLTGGPTDFTCPGLPSNSCDCAPISGNQFCTTGTDVTCAP